MLQRVVTPETTPPSSVSCSRLPLSILPSSQLTGIEEPQALIQRYVCLREELWIDVMTTGRGGRKQRILKICVGFED